jgi:hypothetical protein
MLVMVDGRLVLSASVWCRLLDLMTVTKDEISQIEVLDSRLCHMGARMP